jgi:hypothetical protein
MKVSVALPLESGQSFALCGKEGCLTYWFLKAVVVALSSFVIRGMSVEPAVSNTVARRHHHRIYHKNSVSNKLFPGTLVSNCVEKFGDAVELVFCAGTKKETCDWMV